MKIAISSIVFFLYLALILLPMVMAKWVTTEVIPPDFS